MNAQFKDFLSGVVQRSIQHKKDQTFFLFFFLLITFANSLDPYQVQPNVRPDLDPNCLTLWWYSWKIFSKKLILKKNQQATKKHEKIPRGQIHVTCYSFMKGQLCTLWEFADDIILHPIHSVYMVGRVPIKSSIANAYQRTGFPLWLNCVFISILKYC